MKSCEFAEVLRRINVLSPVTEGFEKETDKKGNRKYGQKDNNRWWDESTGSQKEHLICWFSRGRLYLYNRYGCGKIR